ncbi:mitotic checkpoint regulator, MAD2B-interacting-domain-containing protein [Papiliotrema laurentii]|uniref:Mitotic checkpoint regulator, MAD2B-interacting-domain-containing protein n=1 Tax=Papiliotrema laurentii TaxID=5418 RepID=A0AAD9CSI6_PAPLA|nr:mitotic checkpoint regulator, MAD2B-interacting-domain-containing protein [Papiliotrema laurentii]
MLLANYGSDSGSDSEGEAGPSKPTLPPARPAVVPSTVGNAGTPPVAKSGAKVKRKGPVKITLDLPKSSSGGDGTADADRSEGEADEEPEIKKPKFNIKGKGSSALLGMLPPPKRKLPVGGSKQSLAVNKSMANPRPPTSVPSSSGPDLGGLSAAELAGLGRGNNDDDDDDGDDEENKRSGLMLPASVARGKAKAKAAAPEPTLDLFGLSSAPTPRLPVSSAKLAVPPTISSAPAAPDFIPPPPTAQDPYPGYYQTPTNEWKAYDPAYYASFFPDQPAVHLQGEDHGDDGRVGRHWQEFDSKGADLRDVDVGQSIKKAREEEERRNLMKKPKMPGDEFEYQTIGQTKGLAAQRHQLTSLLHTAYSSREELEERIAQNKKNMRLAGQKYGF